jgi:hypothetical protein
MVRRYVTLEKLTSHNEIAGFKFATVGVLYAVLLAFAIVVVWEKMSAAEADVVQKAGATMTIYRLSPDLGDKAGADLRGAVTNYLQIAIADDWPVMEHGQMASSRTSRQALNDIYATLLTFTATERGGNPVVSEIMYQLDQMTQARRARLVAAGGAVPEILWVVLFGGAIVTVVFTFFRHAKSAGTNHDDRPSRAPHLFGTVDHHRGRPAFHRDGQGGTGRAGDGAGGF